MKTENKLITPTQIEDKVAAFWLSTGAIKIDYFGEENTYYVNEFNNKFYCKNYPNYNN